jgi:hypothetical protein
VVWIAFLLYWQMKATDTKTTDLLGQREHAQDATDA